MILVHGTPSQRGNPQVGYRLGKHCENTHVINKLQLSIYADGLKDLVVAACPDGFLVCCKEHFEEIKKDVENLSPRPMY